jgi:hypothetical protein
MLIYDQAITACFDVDDTMLTDIELKELFETESDGFTMIVYYALKVDWRQLLPTRVHKDMVIPKFCTPTVAAIFELFAQGLYSVTSIATASRLSPSKLCRMVTTMLTTYKPCCVAVRLLPASTTAPITTSLGCDADAPSSLCASPPPLAPSSSPSTTDTLLIDDGAVSSAPYPNQDLLGHVFPNNGARCHDARTPIIFFPTLQPTSMMGILHPQLLGRPHYLPPC